MDEVALRDLETIFRQVEDPRVGRTKRHRLRDSSILAICGVICGAEGWVEIEEFGKAKEAWLTEVLSLPNGIPSHDTFGRVFAHLDLKQFEASCIHWVQASSTTVQGVMAIDGKTLRRSHDRAAGEKALQRVACLGSGKSVGAGSNGALPEKSKEITALPVLLRQLARARCIVTSGAMGTQTRDCGSAYRARGRVCPGPQREPGEPVRRGESDLCSTSARSICGSALCVGTQRSRRVTVGSKYGSSGPSVILRVRASLDPEKRWKGLRGIPDGSSRTACGAGDHEGNALLFAQFPRVENVGLRGSKPLGE
jgi:predicted transposase YbfD/YdcC